MWKSANSAVIPIWDLAQVHPCGRGAFGLAVHVLCVFLLCVLRVCVCVRGGGIGAAHIPKFVL